MMHKCWPLHQYETSQCYQAAHLAVNDLIFPLWLWQAEGSSNHPPSFYFKGPPLSKHFPSALFQMDLGKLSPGVKATFNLVCQVKRMCLLKTVYLLVGPVPNLCVRLLSLLKWDMREKNSFYSQSVYILVNVLYSQTVKFIVKWFFCMILCSVQFFPLRSFFQACQSCIHTPHPHSYHGSFTALIPCESWVHGMMDAPLRELLRRIRDVRSDCSRVLVLSDESLGLLFL